ncbi:N-acetylmuramoyl-L-alanine amidase [Paraflavisolibacter sp. H34]|uniref:N-acetylmuramoyl-L-alanine amidase n=1 Tax=Huijunlia imazamoxiresistens TaxID=3127457 RepID=UPI0030197183
MNRYSFLFVAAAACLLGAMGCQRNPYAAANKLYKKQAKAFSKVIRKAPLADSLPQMGPWVGTTNFNLRKPNFVIIHHTAQNSCAQTLKTFTLQKTQVSAHYLVCRDGTIHHLLNDYLRAWHGGVARWGNVTDINSTSIGIELDNNGSEPFTDPQIGSLLELLQTLKKAYGIPAPNFIGHADIAPSRKVDPSRLFPWDRLAADGFGLWYGDTTCLQVPAHFSPATALRLIGYDTRDSLAAARAFRLHYLRDSGLLLDEPAQKILYSLQQLSQ